MTIDAGDSVYALLTDGATIEIRPARPGDFDAVRDMHAKMSPKNLYLRFFSMSPSAAEQEARRICREPAPDHAALLAVLDGEVVGCGTYEQDGAGSRSAEVALAVDDDRHNRGIGMLLLEHLVALGRGRGFRAFTAQTLSENAAMLRVFADAGLQAQRSLADGVYDLTFPLPAGEADAALGTYLDTVAARERAADVASMQPVPTPASVVVDIAASRRAGSVGPGHPAQHHLGGLPARSTRSTRTPPNLQSASPACRRWPAPPDEVDLAVIAVPAACWRHSSSTAGRSRGQGPGGDRGRAQRPGPRGAAGDLPPPRHADGGAGQFRRGQPRHRPGRDIRRPPCPGGNRRPGAAVHRRHRLHAAGAPVPAGRGHLLPGLLRRQGRRVRYRHAAVVGVRQGDQAGPAVPGIDREPAEVAAPPAASAAPCRS